MKYVFLLLLALFICTDSFGQALDALPGIDEPQDADRIHTYTRGFSAAFQLDTLRKYFAADLVEGLAVDPYTSIPDSLRGRFFTSTSDSLYYVDYSGVFYNFTKLQKNAEDYAETNFSVKKPATSTNEMALYYGASNVDICFIGDSNGERGGSYATLVSASGMTVYGNGGIGYMYPTFVDGDTNPAWGWGKTTRSAGWTMYGKDDIGAEPDMPFLRKIESSNTSDTIRYERNDDYILEQGRLNSRARIFSGKNGAAYEYRINNGSWVTVTTPSGGGIHVELINSDANISRIEMIVTVRPKTGTLEHHGVAITSESGGVSSMVPYNLSVSGASTAEHAAIERGVFIDVLTALSPDIVIIAHSTNDQNLDITPAQHRANLDTIANRVLSATGFEPVFITGIANTNDATATYKMSEYAAVVESAANDRGAKIVNLYDIFSPTGIYNADLFADGVHYSNEQMAKIAKLVMNKISIPVISLSRTTPFKYDASGYKLISPIDERLRLGLGIPRTNAAFGVEAEPLQILSPDGGTGVKISGDEAVYAIYAKNSTTATDDAAGYFYNDLNGYGIHARARNGYPFWSQGTGTGSYLYGGDGGGRGIRLETSSFPMWLTDKSGTTGARSESFYLEQDFPAYAAGGGSGLGFLSRLNGGTSSRTMRFGWEFTDAGSTAKATLAVLGSGIGQPLSAYQYEFGGGTAGVFSAPGLSISNSADFNDVEVENIGTAIAPASAVPLQQLIDSLATAGGGGVPQTVSQSSGTITLSDGGGSIKPFETSSTGTTGSDSWDDFGHSGVYTKYFRSTALDGPPIAAHYIGVNYAAGQGSICQVAYPMVQGQGSVIFFRIYNPTGSTWSDWETSSSILTENLKTDGNWISGDGGNEGIHVSSTGNVGINQSSTAATFDILTSAISGRESLMRAKVSDAGSAQFGIGNGTTSSGQFRPTFFAYNPTSNYPLLFKSMTNPANGASGDPMFYFQAVTTNSDTDPLNGTASTVGRDIIGVLNNGSNIFSISADGDVDAASFIGDGSGLTNIPTDADVSAAQQAAEDYADANETDNQTLSVSGRDIAITGGNTISVPVTVTNGRIVLLGNSITEGNESEAPDIRNIANFHWANFLKGHYFKDIIYAGVGGNIIPQMAERFDADVAAYSPEWVMIAGGSNDVSGMSTTVDSSLNRMEEMLIKCNAAGYKVLLLTVYPSASFSTAAQANYYAELNAGIVALAAAYANVFLVDGAGRYIDKTTDYPQPVSESTRDGVHHNEQSASLTGLEIAKALDAHIATVPDIIQFAGDSSLVNANKFLTGTAGTLTNGGTGTAPTGYRVGRGRGEERTNGYRLSINESNSPQCLLQITGGTVAVVAGEKYRIRVMIENPQGTFRRITTNLTIGADAVNTLNAFPDTEEASTFKINLEGRDMFIVSNELTVSTTGTLSFSAFLQFYGEDWSSLDVTSFELVKTL